MCKMCEGQTFEAAVDEMATRIAEHGWTLQGVEPSPGHHQWIYSVGLVENFDHPELILVGLDVRRAYDLLTCMVERVVDRGKVLVPGEVLCHGVAHTRVGRVHPAHRAGDWFNWWFNYYRSTRVEAPQLRALQILWSEAHGPFPTVEHPWRSQPVLALPPARDRQQPRTKRHPKGRRR